MASETNKAAEQLQSGREEHLTVNLTLDIGDSDDSDESCKLAKTISSDSKKDNEQNRKLNGVDLCDSGIEGTSTASSIATKSGIDLKSIHNKNESYVGNLVTSTNEENNLPPQEEQTEHKDNDIYHNGFYVETTLDGESLNTKYSTSKVKTSLPSINIPPYHISHLIHKPKRISLASISTPPPRISNLTYNLEQISPQNDFHNQLARVLKDDGRSGTETQWLRILKMLDSEAPNETKFQPYQTESVVNQHLAGQRLTTLECNDCGRKSNHYVPQRKPEMFSSLQKLDPLEMLNSSAQNETCQTKNIYQQHLARQGLRTLNCDECGRKTLHDVPQKKSEMFRPLQKLRKSRPPTDHSSAITSLILRSRTRTRIVKKQDEPVPSLRPSELASKPKYNALIYIICGALLVFSLFYF